MKKMLITGAAGFLGYFIVKKFILDYQLICLVRPGSKNLIRLKEFENTIEIVEHDIKNPYPLELVNKFKDVDIIVHAGGNPSSELSLLNPVEAISDNIFGTLNLLELSRNLNLKKFIFLSAGEVFGPVPIGSSSKENDPYNSVSIYGASKASCEELCIAYSNNFNIPVSIIHITNTFGEMSQSNRFPVIVIKKLLNDEEIDIHIGNNNAISGRKWLYAGDVADHIDFIINNQKSKCEKWNSAGSQFINNQDFASMIAVILNKKIKYNFKFSNRTGHDLCFSLDTSKLYSSGWNENNTLHEKLEKTINWYLKNPSWLNRK